MSDQILKFNCPECEKLLKVKADRVPADGKKVKCPNCGVPFLLHPKNAIQADQPSAPRTEPQSKPKAEPRDEPDIDPRTEAQIEEAPAKPTPRSNPDIYYSVTHFNTSIFYICTYKIEFSVNI